MADYSIPAFFIANDGVQITLSIPQTDAVLTNQQYTYNQAGLVYNQIGVNYGGVNNATEDVIPSFSNKIFADSIPSLNIPSIFPSITVDLTQAFLSDQGYQYNQAGLTYNQTGVDYGGVNNATEDATIFPHIAGFYDIYTQGTVTPPSSSGIPLGPGFFMFLTQ